MRACIEVSDMDYLVHHYYRGRIKRCDTEREGKNMNASTDRIKPGANLSGAFLSCADLAGATLTNADLSDLILAGVDRPPGRV